MFTRRLPRSWRATLWLAPFLGCAQLAASSSALPAGAWTLRVEWPGGPADVVLTVTDREGVLAAIWTGPQGQLTARSVTFGDDVLAFVIEPEDQNGDTVTLRFEGRIVGEQIDGRLLTPRGAVIKVTGQRSP